MTLQQTLLSVPFLSALHITVEAASPGEVVLRLPAIPSNCSTLGTLHSGALFSVGELAASVALGTHPALVHADHLQISSRIAYRTLCSTDVTAHASLTDEVVAAIVEATDDGRQARCELAVELMDGHGKEIAQLTCLFAFRPHRS